MKTANKETKTHISHKIGNTKADYRDNLWYEIGFLDGEIKQLEEFMPFRSLRWWVIFLLGMCWGLMIALWTLTIFK